VEAVRSACEEKLGFLSFLCISRVCCSHVFQRRNLFPITFRIRVFHLSYITGHGTNFVIPLCCFPFSRFQRCRIFANKTEVDFLSYAWPTSGFTYVGCSVSADRTEWWEVEDREQSVEEHHKKKYIRERSDDSLWLTNVRCWHLMQGRRTSRSDIDLC